MSENTVDTPENNIEQNGKEPVYLKFSSNALLMELCGRHDAHLQQVEERLGVQLVTRGNQLAILGPADQVEKAKIVLEDLYELLQSGLPVAAPQIDAALRVTDGLLGAQLRPSDLMGQDVILNTPNKKVAPRSVQQHVYVAALQSSSLTFGLGPAGTGKTYLATAYAVQGLIQKKYKKLILTRPVVEAGERLGFLPGTLEEKIDPYLRPFFDALDDMVGREKVDKWREQGVIEIAPLAYMRGRTLEKCIMILDEAQNTTTTQMRMFLTRMGEGSKAIATGDITQSDLPKSQISGLKQAVQVLEGLADIEVTRFSEADVVRHELVARIVQAYEEKDRQISMKLDSE
ncbi:MAG: PhoH family protein [Alphaproteobacteria bacterium]|nr:PhoH family protein [Alphaproteobacteria bacterium]MDD9919582.1 PhoH family protein [Alphaproteobacteria bacterium]